MRVLLAVWFLAHGIAHLPGFIVAWKLGSFPSLPFHTTVLADSIDIGTVGIRAVGLLWLLAAVAFAALAATLRIPWWREAAYVVLGVSLMLCILGWPQSRIGVVSNLVVAALLFTGTARLGMRCRLSAEILGLTAGRTGVWTADVFSTVTRTEARSPG